MRQAIDGIGALSLEADHALADHVLQVQVAIAFDTLRSSFEEKLFMFPVCLWCQLYPTEKMFLNNIHQLYLIG